MVVEQSLTLTKVEDFPQATSMKLASYVENQLILAEAKFKTGNESGALEHLNNVRADLRVQYDSADGFPDSTASGNTLLKQILGRKVFSFDWRISYFP